MSMQRADKTPTWLGRHAITIIFLFVYVLMSLLIVEQGRTIDSQQQLIRSLFQDTLEMSHLKAQQLQLNHR